MNKLTSKITAVFISAALAVIPVSYAELTAGPDTAMAAEVSAAGRSWKKYVVKADQLNVRCGPAISYAVIGSLARSQKINVISISGGWAKIKFQGCTAYVSAQYLSKPKKHNAG